MAIRPPQRQHPTTILLLLLIATGCTIAATPEGLYRLDSVETLQIENGSEEGRLAIDYGSAQLLFPERNEGYLSMVLGGTDNTAATTITIYVDQSFEYQTRDRPPAIFTVDFRVVPETPPLVEEILVLTDFRDGWLWLELTDVDGTVYELTF